MFTSAQVTFNSAVIMLCACALAMSTPGYAESQSSASHSAQVVEAHLTFLADDLLEGRGAGRRGEKLAALYISSEFRRLGLVPMGGDGFRQPVPLRSARLDPGSVRFAVSHAGETRLFANGEDIFVSPSRVAPRIDTSAQAVFAGHGIVAPELGIDDYAGLEVAGKVVITLGGAPASLPPSEAAHFGSGATKNRIAAERGAIGRIRVWMPMNEAQIPFAQLRSFLITPAMTWVGPQGEVMDEAPRLALRASVRGAAAEALFSGAPRSLSDVTAQGVDQPVAGFPLTSVVSLALETRFDDSAFSQNVAGFLEGFDPELRDEVVVVTAHYDHLGFCGAIDAQDRICNGALDNALGTAALLDVARRFSEAENRPRRSILFLAVGAEEQGLLGAEYFVRFPTLGERRMVANINMDGGLPFYDFSDVIAFGAEQSTLGQTLADAIAPLGLSVSPDPFPELSIFTRSDQYAFVKQGIPALFMYHGFTDMAGDNVGRPIWDEFLARHYHRPSDEASLPINYDVAAKYADVFFRTVFAVAHADAAPRWRPDSAFSDLFSGR